MVCKRDRSSRVKKRRRRRIFCPECGGKIILARENEYYTATEPCCSSCGLVYEDELIDLWSIFLRKINLLEKIRAKRSISRIKFLSLQDHIS